ncbi:MAG: 50S ribosomal protein L9 [Nitrospirota bacterium]
MKVILREEIQSLGQPGAIVEVSDGYARNFLLPRKKAVPATPANLNAAQAAQRRIEAQQAEARAEAEQLAQRLGATTVTIPVQAGEDGKLFGAVTAKDIAEALVNAGLAVDKRMIELDSPIKQTGEVTVTIRLQAGVSAPLRVTVAAEGEPPAPKKSRKKKSE